MARNVLIIGSGNKVDGDVENLAIINSVNETYDNTFSDKTVLQNKKVVISDTLIEASELIINAAQDIRGVLIDNTDSPYQCVQDYSTVFVDATGGDVDVYLNDFGIAVNIVRVDSSANTITIYSNDSPPNIDGQSYYELVSKFDGCEFTHSAGVWYSNRYKHSYNVKSFSANTANNHIYDVYLGDASGGALAFTLDSYNKQVTVKKIDTGGHKITITPTIGNIEGAASYDLLVHNDYVTVVFDGSNWWVIAQ